MLPDRAPGPRTETNAPVRRRAGFPEVPDGTGTLRDAGAIHVPSALVLGAAHFCQEDPPAETWCLMSRFAPGQAGFQRRTAFQRPGSGRD